MPLPNWLLKFEEAMRGAPLDPRAMAEGMGTAPSEGAARFGSNFLPGAGDFVGLAQDAEMFYSDPSSRTLGNGLLAVLGMAPGIPRLPKKLYRGTKGGKGIGTALLGRGLYTSPYKSKAKLYGEVSEIPLEVGMPKNPLYIEGAGRGDAPSQLNDWLLEHSGEKNIRDFNKKYPDRTEYLKSLGYDGVWIDDEIVKF